MTTFKQKIGVWLIPKLPISNHLFNHIRLEVNAWRVRTLHHLHPGIIKKVKQLHEQNNLLVNIGCGPFGEETGWVNLDLFNHPNLTFVSDTRRSLSLADNSCAGIHVEHFLEHLDLVYECPAFLNECYRCLQTGGVLRIIVPDAELYIRAYLQPGWDTFNSVGCGGDNPEKVFASKMEALNHVFIQGWEHYGGYDAESLELTLRKAGFTKITRCNWQTGNFPVDPIDREQHRTYSLYFEAVP
jgi:predicted SAM-dependent methyltransferase